MDIPVSGILGLVARLLELFRQKASVYVEVSFGVQLPYALTVLNRSSFHLIVDGLLVEPDGFPTLENGWSLSGAGLFRGQRLVPGQRIRFFFSSSDVGTSPVRKFTVSYSTLIRSWRIPRASQTCEYAFRSDSNVVSVSSSQRFRATSLGTAVAEAPVDDARHHV